MVTLPDNTKWHDWLVDQGIISLDDQAYHVIIDIDVSKPIEVHVSRYGEDLRVDPPDVHESCIIRDADPPLVGDSPKVMDAVQ